MSTGYEVDLAAMAGLVTSMGTCAGDMELAVRALRELDPGTSGHAELDHACADFQDRWGHGIALIRQLADSTVGGLEQTVAAYTQLEATVSQMFPSPDGSPAAPAAAEPIGTTLPAPGGDISQRLRGDTPVTLPAPAPPPAPETAPRRPTIADVMRGNA
ncbi:hypothetical protein [Allostreptomyces psammosilenae]|uniref:Uncharacterized protein n=1 Tax=Allostreptomyces psammosilenae TaxID=1892865 RepID=A0A853A0Q5_9ACTN|nr:hypothetical protein [Allostreptomyces psammosilenae]NYI06514.1 hypothetical protein [Allostreptomyces psammosilenae]